MFITSLLVLFSGWNLVFTFVGGIGIISWGLAALLSGALVSGDRMRANYYTESKEDSKARKKLTMQLFLFGMPQLSIVLILFLIKITY